jgi:hypothetical protein
MKNKRTLFIGLAFFFASVCFVFFIETQFKKGQQIPFIDATTKNWSHRGYAKTEEKENTKTAISLALQNDYKGVEIDIWFKEDLFFVSHEESYEDSLLQLQDVFSTFPDTYFWLDLKNLSLSNYKQIANQLEKLNKNKDTYLIESKNGLPLGLLHKKGFHTTYWVMNSNFIRHFFEKCWIVCFQYNGISMPATNYQKEHFRKKYKHLNIHLWDKQPNQGIYHWDEVKIILDDNELE